MTELVLSPEEEKLDCEIRSELHGIHACALQHGLWPKVIAYYFEVGCVAGSFIGNLRRGDPGQFASDISMDAVFALMMKHSDECNISPRDLILACDIGLAAMQMLAEAKTEDLKSVFIPPEEEAVFNAPTPASQSLSRRDLRRQGRPQHQGR